MSRWHEECLSRCLDDCTSAAVRAAGACAIHRVYNPEEPCRRFMTVGPVRYGMRVGAVSPPPPGAGPRYRTQCCWTSAACQDAAPACQCDGSVSRIPLLTTPPINSLDIISCANRMRISEDAASEQPLAQSSATVRDHVLYTSKCLLKSQLKRCALVRPQVYTRLTDYGDANGKEDPTLDRLPIFRFGGNRAGADRRGNDQRLRDFTDRLKRGGVPVPPPRTRHPRTTPPVSPQPPNEQTLSVNSRTAPLRSASFSQVDYCSDDNKYIRKKLPTENQPHETSIATLPRSKRNTPEAKPSITIQEVSRDASTPLELTNLFEVISKECSSLTSPDDQSIEDSPDKKRDKSRRRKGIYISQWPNSPSPENLQQKENEQIAQELNESNEERQEESQNREEQASPDVPVKKEEKDTLKIVPFTKGLFRSDSLSEGEPENSERKSDQVSLVPSDVSDCEGRISDSNIPRRYSKRPLRGPYGQMLEAEMKKPEAGRKPLNSDLKFLEDFSALPVASNKKDKKSRSSCNSSIDESAKPVKVQGVTKRKMRSDSLVVPNEVDPKLIVSHQRTTSSPSKLEGLVNSEVSSELLEQLLQGSSEHLAANDASQQLPNDTRTHVVIEIIDNERIYVESLQILVTKYWEPLKQPENVNLLDPSLVDEIFYQIPVLLNHHQSFLDELKKRLEHWDVKQKIGDIFMDTFSKQSIFETYTNYVNNFKRARDILKNAQQSKPAFNRFLESTAREHKGKLALDSLMIKPIQRFPKYELLLQRLIKHTDVNHPDHALLMNAQKLIRDLLLKLNCTERETWELEQLREIEGLIEGLIELVSADRQYLRHDLVSMTAGGAARKERALFLFSDILLITSIKRRSGTIRRPITSQGSVTSTLEANKYKLLMRIPLEDLDIVRSKDDNIRQMMIEVDNLTKDIGLLNQINELSWSMNCGHTQLDEVVKDMLTSLNKQLLEQQNSDSQLACLDLTLNTSNGLENISIVFSKAEKRTSWEESFNEAKQKLAMTGYRKPCPELLATVPIRKTRAGLQFTCAAPTLGENGKDVWVCNSDGHVGQVCILSLQPEATVTSCNGVCNARILCITSVPGTDNGVSKASRRNNNREEEDVKTMQFDSSSSSDEEEKSDSEKNDEPQRTADSAETSSLDLDEADNMQSTMWLGTEDGFIHVYNSNDNIRIKKNKIRLQLSSSILCIIYLDNRVFVSLANGDIVIYDRDSSGGWNINSPTVITVGSISMPISKMLPSGGKLWCGCGSTIKIFNTHTLLTENSFIVNNDNNKPITCLVLSTNSVWLSLQNSAIIKCFHASSFELLCEMNVAPSVTKMLTSCDDIIRQHKAACLRVTALVACKDLLWIGTSAGVLLTMPLPHVSSTTTKLAQVPTVTGVSHGHTGHVRFLTSVEMPFGTSENQHRNSYKGKQDQRSIPKLLVISGGDGYEDFRISNLSEVAGREDSTNHLLLWNI